MTRKEALKKMQTFMDFFPAAKSEMQEAIDALCEPKWVSVKEDLPCNHEELLYDYATKTVIVMFIGGGIALTYMSQAGAKWHWNCMPGRKVAYWMPLPELP